MKNSILTALTLVGLIHYGSSADILKGMLVASDDTKCLSVTGTSTPVTGGDLSVCGVIMLKNADAGGYIIADATDATKQLTLGTTEGAASSVTASGTALSFKGTPAISGLTKDDVSLVIDKSNPFRIQPKTGIPEGQFGCLKQDTTYSLSDADTTCATQLWYFKIDDCTDDKCNACSLGAGMCTDCMEMYALDSDKACKPCTEANTNCNECAYNAASPPVLECSGCKDMYALGSTKDCKPCTEATANCNTCAYNTADTPALECSACKDGYKLKDGDKSCEKEDSNNGENSALMQTASALGVMVTVMLGMLQRYNY